MGKKYFCEYCSKSMVDNYITRKKHFDSVNHKMLVKLHYAEYRDYKTLIEEESNKKLCLKSVKGQCSFGEKCYNTHYTKEQLDEIQYQGIQQEQELIEKSKYKILNTDLTPWFNSIHSIPICFQQNINMNSNTKLPLSLQPMNIERVKHIEITEWG